MITLQVLPSDWETAKLYWSNIKRHYLATALSNKEQTDFIDTTIFKHDVAEQQSQSMRVSSVVYNSIESLLNGLNSGNIECISKIMRIKNGFTKILDWKSFEEAEYCDIKLNVVFTNGSKKSMIVEIQFLISSLLNTAKLPAWFFQKNMVV